MRPFLSTSVLALCVSGLASAPDRTTEPENAYKKAEVGDWATFKLSQEVGGKTNDAILKCCVSAKDNKAVTVAGTLTIDKKVMPLHDLTIELAKAYDVTNPLAEEGAEDVVKKDEGREKITIGKNTYDCHGVTITCTRKNRAKNVQGYYEYKIWTCDDVPMGGLVKMVKKSSIETITLTLDNSGTGK